MAIASGPDIVEDGLVLYLDAANERSYPGSGTDLYDISKEGMDSSLLNGTAYTSGPPSYFTFDKVNDYINVPDNSKTALQLTGNLTISIWFRPHDYASSRQGLIGRQSGLSEYAITLETPGTVSFYFQSANQPSNYYNGASFQPFGQENNVWQLLTITRDFSSSVVFYKNASQTTTTNITTVTPPSATTSNTRIGIGNGGYYDGDVGLVTLYNRALTAAEVLQNFNAIRSRYGL